MDVIWIYRLFEFDYNIACLEFIMITLIYLLIYINILNKIIFLI